MIIVSIITLGFYSVVFALILLGIVGKITGGKFDLS